MLLMQGGGKQGAMVNLHNRTEHDEGDGWTLVDISNQHIRALPNTSVFFSAVYFSVMDTVPVQANECKSE